MGDLRRVLMCDGKQLDHQDKHPACMYSMHIPSPRPAEKQPETEPDRHKLNNSRYSLEYPWHGLDNRTILMRRSQVVP